MSPEVIKNSPGGRLGAMDIWSLGMVVIELATGKKPWYTAENEVSSFIVFFHTSKAQPLICIPILSISQWAIMYK